MHILVSPRHWSIVAMIVDARSTANHIALVDATAPAKAAHCRPLLLPAAAATAANTATARIRLPYEWQHVVLYPYPLPSSSPPDPPPTQQDPPRAFDADPFLTLPGMYPRRRGCIPSMHLIMLITNTRHAFFPTRTVSGY